MKVLVKAAALLLAGGVAAAMVAYHMTNRPQQAPGHGRACELVLVNTGERVPTTWDKVWPLKPMQSPVNGFWLVEYPAKSGQYAYVVDPGVKPPIPATRTR